MGKVMRAEFFFKKRHWVSVAARRRCRAGALAPAPKAVAAIDGPCGLTHCNLGTFGCSADQEVRERRLSSCRPVRILSSYELRLT